MSKRTTPTSRDSDKFVLRMPDGMRDKLSELAKASGRSMNAEMVHRLQRTLDEDAEYADSDGVVYLDSLNAKPREPAQSYTLFSDKDLAELARALLKEARERETKAAGKEEEK